MEFSKWKRFEPCSAPKFPGDNRDWESLPIGVRLAPMLWMKGSLGPTRDSRGSEDRNHTFFSECRCVGLHWIKKTKGQRVCCTPESRSVASCHRPWKSCIWRKLRHSVAEHERRGGRFTGTCVLETSTKVERGIMSARNSLGRGSATGEYESWDGEIPRNNQSLQEISGWGLNIAHWGHFCVAEVLALEMFTGSESDRRDSQIDVRAWNGQRARLLVLILGWPGHAEGLWCLISWFHKWVSLFYKYTCKDMHVN